MKIRSEIKDKWVEKRKTKGGSGWNMVDAGAVSVGKHELVDQHQEIGNAPGFAAQSKLREFGSSSLHGKSSNELVYYNLNEKKTNIDVCFSYSFNLVTTEIFKQLFLCALARD